MNCLHCESLLTAFTDGELGLLARWRVQHHLRRCASCAHGATGDLRLRETARSLAVPAVPVGLRERIQACLEPAPPTDGARVGRSRAGRWLAAPALALGTLCVLAAVQWSRPVPAAAAMRQAVQRANTWRLEGWKEMDGQRVPWKIWGRFQPYFYREEVGSRVTLDDGTQRYQILPPPADERQAILLRTASRPGTEAMDWKWDAMFQRWEQRDRVGQTLTSYTASSTRGFMGLEPSREYRTTVDRLSGLPVRYEVRRQSEAGEQTVERLNLEFGVPLSSALSRPPTAAETYRIDTVTEPVQTPALSGNVVRQNGLTAEFVPLGRSPGGLVLVRARLWAGEEHLEGERSRVALAPEFHPGARYRILGEPLHQDEQGRDYVEVDLEKLRLGHPKGERLLLFTLAEPLAGRSPSQTLSIRVQASAVMARPVDGDADKAFTISALQADLSAKLSLQGVPPMMNLDRYLDPQWREENQGKREVSLQAEVARTRARHFNLNRERREHSPQYVPQLRKAMDWTRQALRRPELSRDRELRQMLRGMEEQLRKAERSGASAPRTVR